MSKFSTAVNKMNKLKLEKHPLDKHTSDNPKITQLKKQMVDLADRVKKEGIQ